MNELKSCPFCGGESEKKRGTANQLFNPTVYYYIQCKSCGATGAPNLVPKHATYDNAQLTIETIKSAVDYIVQAIQSVQ